ncbi:hypothetical protein TWF730_008947 [Orbilia blumenaviensis]|uniref:Uncharacterized protein n=1 Tax=Orbilia blumenaviensis TaxID=1796055 RepID=A0AAV9UWZ3_9PEZI
MEYHQIDPFYPALMTENCMRAEDYEIVDFIVESKGVFGARRTYSHEPARQIDDIHVQVVKYANCEATLPTWLYLKHEMFPDMCRKLRDCYQDKKNNCHGTMDDHINLIMKTLWGPGSIVKDSERYRALKTFRGTLYRLFDLNPTMPHGVPVLESHLGQIMVRHDVETVRQRQKWRAENMQSVLQSMIGDGSNAYVHDQAKKLLYPGREGGPRKREADELLYQLGWQRRERLALSTFPKENLELMKGFAEWKEARAARENEMEEEEDQEEEQDINGIEQAVVLRLENGNADDYSNATAEQKENHALERYGIQYQLYRQVLEEAFEELGLNDKDEKAEVKKEGKLKSATKRFGTGILRFMKIKKK